MRKGKKNTWHNSWF